MPSNLMEAMKNEPTFHGTLTRHFALRVLSWRGGNCYLTRYSTLHKTCVISALRTVKDRKLLENFKLNITPCPDSGFVYKIEGTEKEFKDIMNLLDFYKRNPVTSEFSSLGKGIEKKKAAKEFYQKLSSHDLVNTDHVILKNSVIIIFADCSCY